MGKGGGSLHLEIVLPPGRGGVFLHEVVWATGVIFYRIVERVRGGGFLQLVRQDLFRDKGVNFYRISGPS